MMQKRTIQPLFLAAAFGLYALFLAKLLLLSRLSSGEARSVNMIPFAAIWEYLTSTDKTVRQFSYANVVGNVVAFVPLGAFLCLFWRGAGAGKRLLAVLGVSLAVEVIQGGFGIGAADVDDLILNTLGGGIGILGYGLLHLLLRREPRVRMAMTIFAALGLPVLLFLVFRVNLRL